MRESGELLLTRMTTAKPSCPSQERFLLWESTFTQVRPIIQEDSGDPLKRDARRWALKESIKPTHFILLLFFKSSLSGSAAAVRCDQSRLHRTSVTILNTPDKWSGWHYASHYKAVLGRLESWHLCGYLDLYYLTYMQTLWCLALKPKFVPQQVSMRGTCSAVGRWLKHCGCPCVWYSTQP